MTTPFFDEKRKQAPNTEAVVVRIRCFQPQCTRVVELMSTDSISLNGWVRIGHNLYYCAECAAATDYAADSYNCQ